jgi:proteasome lid subunit RPN8/RPN11
MRRLDIGTAVLAAMREHASAVYPAECCGALIGTAGGNGKARVVSILSLPNATEDSAHRRFLVKPSDYRAAEARAAATGADLIGFYHSHPDHPARPSAYDLAHAWPNLSYVILSVARGRPVDVRSWRLLDDRSDFVEENLRTEHGHPSAHSHAPAPVHRQARRR